MTVRRVCSEAERRSSLTNFRTFIAWYDAAAWCCPPGAVDAEESGGMLRAWTREDRRKAAGREQPNGEVLGIHKRCGPLQKSRLLFAASIASGRLRLAVFL